MLMRKQQLRRGLHGSGLVTMHSSHLVRPLPALADEPEAEATDIKVFAGAGGQDGRDRVLTVLGRRCVFLGALHVGIIPSGFSDGYCSTPPGCASVGRIQPKITRERTP